MKTKASQTGPIAGLCFQFSSHIHLLSTYCVPGSGRAKHVIVLPSRYSLSREENRRPPGFSPAPGEQGGVGGAGGTGELGGSR